MQITQYIKIFYLPIPLHFLPLNRSLKGKFAKREFECKYQWIHYFQPLLNLKLRTEKTEKRSRFLHSRPLMF